MTHAGTIPAATILDMPLADLREALDAGRISSRAIVAACLDRIEADNDRGKALHAVIALNPAALDTARLWDEARANGRAKHGPLAGIPFLAKDNFDTREMVTSGGSAALAHSVPSKDAAAIQALVDAGAILLGKTNMSELAASHGWFGYSSLGGQTVNPFNPLRDAAGSSSGSAVAVAARFAPFALGTDTSGSIRAPASTTGTVGLRPTFGLTSRAGVIPLSLSFDTVGVITRTVADQAVVLDVIRGRDPADAATLLASHPATPLADSLAADALRGAHLGLVTNFLGGNDEVDDQLSKAQAILVRAGAEVSQLTLPAPFEELWSRVLGPVGTAEFRVQFDAYLATLSADQPRTMAAFMTRLSSLTDGGTRGINPARYDALVDALNAPAASAGYIGALTRTIPALRDELTAIVQGAGLDALVFATMSCPASVIPGKTDPRYLCRSQDPYAACYIAAATGFPEISVPIGVDAANVPIGLSILGKANDDAKILAYAADFERHR